jgi:hypothetical protein
VFVLVTDKFAGAGVAVLNVLEFQAEYSPFELTDLTFQVYV